MFVNYYHKSKFYAFEISNHNLYICGYLLKIANIFNFKVAYNYKFSPLILIIKY